MAFVTSLPLTRAPPTTPSTSQKFVIRAAKHVQFKGAKKADRCRPKKHRPSDIHRAPPPFNPQPLRAEGLPPVLEVFKPDQADAAFAGMTTLVDAAMVEQYEKTLLEPVPVAEAQPITEAQPPTAEATVEEATVEEATVEEATVEEATVEEATVEEADQPTE